MSAFASPVRALIFATALSFASAAQAATLDLATATIADVQAAFGTGKLTAEALTQAYLARVSAYDKQGPGINAVITLNPKALAEAKALDAERKAGKVRGPLHGIPVVLKDNYNTFDLPTTAGSQLLKGSIPPSDSFMVKKLRDAGVVVIAKVNLSEFAGSGGSVSGATDPEVLKLGAVPNGFSSMGVMFSGVIQIVVFLMIPFYISWQVTIISVLVGGCFSFVLAGMNRHAYQWGKENTDTANQVMGRISESFILAKVI